MKTIVVLGAGIAAAPIIRQLMRTVVLKRKDLRMVVVAPNTHFLWPIAMPRVVVPGQLPDDKVMFPLEPIFREYPADRFEFVLGSAASLDPEARFVQVALNAGGESRAVSYDTLVVATGASAKDDMPWKVLDTIDKTTERLRRLQKDIEGAKTVVVAGGGLTGAETAGELGFEYAKSGKKDVYFIYAGELPLSPPVLESVRKQTKYELEKMGVKVMANTTVTSAAKSGNKTVLELRSADGKTKTLTTDAYLPTTGVRPNTSFAPASMLDGQGYLKQTRRLQAEGYPDIFIAGDAGNLEASRALTATTQATHLVKALPAYLGGEGGGEVAEYEVNTKEMVAVTLGRSKGTGQMGTFKIFSFLVWWLKGRFLGTDYAPLLPTGKKTMMTTFEK